MNPTENKVASSEAYDAARRNRMLIYGFVVSIIGLPIGVLLREPVVWGLAVLGIVVGGIKIVLSRSGN